MLVFLKILCILATQGSVVTQLKCGWIFNKNFISNCSQNMAAEMKIGQYLAKTRATTKWDFLRQCKLFCNETNINSN